MKKTIKAWALVNTTGQLDTLSKPGRSVYNVANVEHYISGASAFKSVPCIITYDLPTTSNKNAEK